MQYLFGKSRILFDIMAQDLPSSCSHRAELTGDSMVSTTLILTADNPGFQDLQFKQYVTVWIGGWVFVWCDMVDDEEFQRVQLFPSYKPYELILGLFLAGHNTENNLQLQRMNI